MDLKALAATGSAVTATALLGGAASRDVSSSWYRQLDKPSFQPPGAAFPVVWTSLYADVAVSSASALDRLRARGDEEQARRFAIALGANLAANASWTWLFFRW